MDLTSLEKSILKIICFFDILEYPLTLIEIWKWLNIKVDIIEVKNTLQSENLKILISHQSGFFFLKGQEYLISQRIERYSLAHNKFKKAVQIISFLRFFPWLKAVAVYSSLSFSNSKKEGDIDLFIIADKDRLWSCRFFVNSFLKVFHLRPTKSSSQDKICVSFLVSEDNLNISSVNNHNDPLYTCGDGNFLFLYDEKNIANRFFSDNIWLQQEIPNWFPININYRRKINSDFKIVKNFFELIFSLIPEKYYKKLQLKILPPRIKELQNLDTRVVINDKMIKLHDNDKRQQFQQLFDNKLNQILQDND